MSGSDANTTTPSRGRGYLAESIEELKKVHTPTREETIRNTWVVMFIIIIVSVCLFVLDFVFNWLMTRLVA